MFERESKKAPKQPGVIADISDGSMYKTNSFFKENENALGLLLYSDGVEIKNPLGAARGTYKVIQVFFTLINIPKNQRSQVDRISLGMIFKEKLLKKYSYEVIFKKMVDDLIKLEDGIVVNIPEPKKVKFGLLLYSADNLEAHQLGGFSSCFSSKSVCRVCHIQYDQLDTNIHDYDGDQAHKKWTVEEYDSIVSRFGQEEAEDEAEDIVMVENLFTPDSDEETEVDDEGVDEYVEEDDDTDEEIDDRGVKSRCPMNILRSFHCISSFPMDLMHDLMEGVVPEDLLSIIRILSSKGWFSIDAYNIALRDFGWPSYETGDKPQSVPISTKSVKLKGKAVSHWVHVRNWPLVLKAFIVDKNDAVLALGLKLHEVTERLTATEFYPYEVQLLKEAVLEYLDMRKDIRLEYPQFLKRPKPKHHFLTHYSEMIKLFGPPITYWTGRFESKHRIAKVSHDTAENVNVKLIFSSELCRDSQECEEHYSDFIR